MKYVFICSPYRPIGKDLETELKNNIDQAKRACRLAMSRGLIPLAPHLYFTQFLDDNDPQERKFGQQAGKEWMRCVSEVWVVGDRISSGMEEEVNYYGYLIAEHLTGPRSDRGFSYASVIQQPSSSEECLFCQLRRLAMVHTL